jgi:hypothetical protein
MSHNKLFIIFPMIMGMMMSVCVSMNVLAASNYAIYTSVSVAFDASQSLWVFFGTGDKSDVVDTDSYDRMYAVRDSDRSTTHLVSELTSVNSSTTCSPNGSGWVDSLVKSEKVLAAPLVYDRKVYYTTYKPSAVPCSEEGNAFLYVREYICGTGQFSGGAASTPAGTGTPSGAVVSVDELTGAYDVYVATSSSIVDSNPTSHTTQQSDPSQRYTKPKNLIYWRDNRVQ